MRWLVVLTLLAAPLMAETNFAGSWMLNSAKSQYGNFPAPDVMMRTIQQSAGTLKMSTYQKGAQGEVTTELSYTTDGKPSKNGDSTGTAMWQGDALVIESGRDVQGAHLSEREVWTLSADGKTLTIVTKVTLAQQGEFEVKQVFEKAPQIGGAARANF